LISLDVSAGSYIHVISRDSKLNIFVTNNCRVKRLAERI